MAATTPTSQPSGSIRRRNSRGPGIESSTAAATRKIASWPKPSVSRTGWQKRIRAVVSRLLPAHDGGGHRRDARPLSPAGLSGRPGSTISEPVAMTATAGGT